MALKEYKKIDLETGIILDTCLFDDERIDTEGNVTKIPIPEDYREGWAGRRFFNPVWSFELNDWKENHPLEEILKVERELKDRELNQACKESILAGFSHVINGVEYWFSYDKEAQQNFSDAKQAFNDGLIESINWTVKQDGEYTRIPITKAVMQELSMVILQHKDSKISRYRDELMPLVNSAQTVEEVQAITWDYKQET